MKNMLVWSAMATIVAIWVPLAAADVYINEIYFDPPGSTDGTSEYVELRGTANESLDDCYLIFLENENTSTNTGDPGHIEFITTWAPIPSGATDF